MPDLAYTEQGELSASNPLDLAEQVIAANEWAFERRSDSELAAEARGKWSDYGLYFGWSNEISVLHFSVAFDLSAPVKPSSGLYELLAKANERVWIGHFGVDEESNTITYRHSLLLRGVATAAESIEDLIDIAVTECERYFPAFQFFLLDEKKADEALEAAMLECVGEA